MSDRRAIIVGHQGQDGRLLTDLLRKRGCALLGFGRSRQDAWGTIPPVAACRLDRPETIAAAVREIQPHEVYYLAAHHASSQTLQASDICADYQAGLTVNVTGLLQLLESLQRYSPQTRVFYASSGLIFRTPTQPARLDETAPVGPDEPYGFCKALATEICRDYRKRGLFVSVGILFNHESNLRPHQFLSMKLIRAAWAARCGARGPLVVGDLDAVVDWGYAPDFVEAFTRILAADAPDDFVVATGEGRRVREFAAAAYGRVGLDWTAHVMEDPAILVRRRSGRIGDPSKLRRVTGWQPSVTFVEMVSLLVDQACAGSAEGAP